MKRAGSFLWLFLFAGCVAAPSYLQTPDGVRLAYEARTVDNAKGTVLLLHGLGSSLDEWFYLARDLNREGWSTITFDFRGHGFSRQYRDQELEWQNFTQAARDSALRDVETAAALIPAGEPFWLMGSSFGANMAVRYAAKHPEVTGVVLLSPGLEQGGIEISQSVSALSGRPLLMAAAEGDAYAAGSVKYLDESAGEPKKVLIYPDSEAHGQLMLELIPELEKEIIEWIDRNTSRK